MEYESINEADSEKTIEKIILISIDLDHRLELLIKTLPPAAQFRQELENLKAIVNKIKTRLRSFNEDQIVTFLKSSILGHLQNLHNKLSADNAVSNLDNRAEIEKFSDSLMQYLQTIPTKPLDVHSQLEQVDVIKKELNNQSKRAVGIIENLEDYHKKTVERYEETIRKLNETNLTEFTTFKEKSEKIADELVTNLQKLSESAGLHSHYLSGKVLSGFFEDRANTERESAKKWTRATWAAVAIILLSIAGFIFLHYKYAEDANLINPSLLSAKILFTLTLGFIAKWTSKRATRHLAEESKYHRLQINMQTIDSYIDKLKPDSKDEVLKAAALSIFTEAKSNDAPAEYEAISVPDLLKGLIKQDK